MGYAVGMWLVVIVIGVKLFAISRFYSEPGNDDSGGGH